MEQDTKTLAEELLRRLMLQDNINTIKSDTLQSLATYAEMECVNRMMLEHCHVTEVY